MCAKEGGRVLILAHRGELLEQAADKIKKSTGLGCSVEKAEQTGRGAVLPDYCRVCPDVNEGKASGTICNGLFPDHYS